MRKRLALFMLALFLALPCAGCSKILPYVVKSQALVQWVMHSIDLMQQAKEAHFDARPSPDLEARIDQAIANTRSAAIAYDEAAQTATSGYAGDLDESKEHLVAAYETTYKLCEQAGFLSATTPGIEPTLAAGPGVSVSVPSPERLRVQLE